MYIVDCKAGRSPAEKRTLKLWGTQNEKNNSNHHGYGNRNRNSICNCWSSFNFKLEGEDAGRPVANTETIAIAITMMIAVIFFILCTPQF